ncbi:MAG: hypothetical protein R3B47_15190 [Bacteroidia bacterium]
MMTHHSPKDEGHDFYTHTLNTTIDFYWETPIIDRIMTNVIGWLNYQTPHHHFGNKPRYYAGFRRYRKAGLA